MEVKVLYNETQLKAAVAFVAKNNKSFLKQPVLIEENIIAYIREIVSRFPDVPSFIGTMGFMILVDIHSKEGMDADENSISLDILVDPSLSSAFKDLEWIEETIVVKRDSNEK